MKILLIGPIQSTFVKNDIKILSKSHTVEVLDSLKIGRGARAILGMAMVTLHTIWKLFRCDVFVSWFADYYTLIPVVLSKFLGKKAIVIAGGFDVDRLPTSVGFRYGARARKVRGFCAKYSLEWADYILPVSTYADTLLSEMTQSSKKTVLYNGVDLSQFADVSFENEREEILTVSQADTKAEYILKGIDTFIELAKRLPKVKFVVAGLRGAALKVAHEQAKGVHNCKVIPGPLSLGRELKPLYERASAYCQFSLSETFGVAVVEAMACGAMPIISPNGALPEIAGKVGKIVRQLDEAEQAVMQSFSLSPSERREIAKHAENFSLEKRAKKFEAVISELTATHNNSE